jgi:hypothetical protein
MNVKQSISRGLALALLALAVAGCSRIPLSSLWALRGLQFAEVDAAALRALLYLPDGVDLPDGGLTVNVKVERGNGHPDRRELSMRLAPLAGAAAAHGLTPPWSGGHWLALGLPPAEQQRLAELRRELQAWRSADGPDAKRQLSMAAELRGCQRAGAPRPPQDLGLEAWLRWKPGQGDLRLLEGATLADVLPDEQRGPLPRC